LFGYNHTLNLNPQNRSKTNRRACGTVIESGKSVEKFFKAQLSLLGLGG
jgi:hypothetical protein